MSTNYYVHTPDGEEIHLGKFAQGSAFMFRGYPGRGVVDLASWRAQLDLGEVRTEYGSPIRPEELEDLIDDARRQWGRFRRVRPYPDQHDDSNGNRFTNVEFH